MILRSRSYARKEPDRDATLYVIYCEGSKREPGYFHYFEGLSSRIKLEVVKADSQGNNSPSGLYQQACEDIEGSRKDSLSTYEIGVGDHVWFVIDTDEWDAHIDGLRKGCETHMNWHVAQSNPCFEVWLYYHMASEDAGNIILDGCTAWKNYVNAEIPGGFDSRKHPIHIADAILNAQTHFKTDEHGVAYGSTEVFKLGKELYPLVSSALEEMRR